MKRRLALAVFTALTTGCFERELIAPPPERLRSDQLEPSPPLPPTVVDLPLLVDLSTAVAMMEEGLPRRLGNVDRRLQVPGKDRSAYAYAIRRSPFDVKVKGDTIQIGTTIHYQARAWYNPPIGPEIGGSCGISGDEPRARVVISFHPELNRQWQLVTKPRLSYLGALTDTERDQCEVSFLNLDVTGKVLDAARGALRASLPRLAAKLRTLDVKGEVEKIWNEIQKPIELSDSVWLMLQPEGVRLGRLSGGSEILGGTIGIRARPKIETGSKPSVATVPLPELEEADDEETGLNLLIEGRFDYALIGKNLTDLLAGTRISVPGGTLIVRELGVFGIGGGRLALAVRFGGSGSGQIYFVGTPVYDNATGRIVVPDLDYEASTASLLIKGMAWLKADEIREFLRAKATFPSSETMDQLSTLAVKGMNRELVRGVFLTAALDRSSLVRLAPRTDALYLQGHATGHATLVVTDDFFASLQDGDSVGSSAPGRKPPAFPR